MDPRKVDLVIQYALAVASEAEDYNERELGPIHLLKYVYLADLAYAQDGVGSFTEAVWRFHHFGPWSVEIHGRIAPAVQAIHANERRFPSRFKEEDAVRWRVQDPNLAEKLESRLPWSVARAVKQAVHKYHNDTTALLHDVYRTGPMLKAAPEEILDLSPPPAEAPLEEVQEMAPLPVLSKNKIKKLQALVKKRLEENRQTRTLVAPDPAPRYDEVFARGQEWLDQQAGDPVKSERGRIRFSNEVWRSPGRRDPEIP
jgi:hypothetical protein